MLINGDRSVTTSVHRAVAPRAPGQALRGAPVILALSHAHDGFAIYLTTYAALATG